MNYFCVPWFVVAREHAHVATSHKVLVLEAEERISGRQELGMENDLDPIVTIIEQLATSQAAHDGIRRIVDDVVSRYRWKKRRALSKDTPLQTNDVVFGELKSRNRKLV